MLKRSFIMLMLTASIGACAQAARVQSSGALDDASITARVKTVLLNDTQVAATKIDVVSNQGVVTLSGLRGFCGALKGRAKSSSR